MKHYPIFRCKTLLFLTILFCSTLFAKQEPPEYMRYSHELSLSFIEDMHREFGLIPVENSESMPQDIEFITVQFICQQKATIDQACKWEVKVTEKLLEKINN